MSKAGAKIIVGLSDAVAHARIRQAWKKWKKPAGSEPSIYDWGFKDGVESCMGLFGTEHNVRVKRKPK